MALSHSEKYLVSVNLEFRRRVYVAYKEYVTQVVRDTTDFVTPSIVEQYAHDVVGQIREGAPDVFPPVIVDASIAFATVIDDPDFLGNGITYAAILAALEAQTNDAEFTTFVTDYISDLANILANRT